MYIETRFMPRFCDSDAAGHINNTAVAQWLEAGRFDLFQNHLVGLGPFMCRRVEINYLSEMNYTQEACIRTGIQTISEKTISVYQEIWQGGSKRADGLTVDCYFDAETRRSAVIPPALRPLCDGFHYEVGSA